jgi:hypothetical protein
VRLARKVQQVQLDL